MNFLDGSLIKKNGNIYITNKGFSLRMPPESTKKIEKYIDKEVVLGIRPELLDSTQTFKDFVPETTFKASVWVMEPLGSEKLCHIRNEDNTLVARLDPKVTLKAGDAAEFSVKMEGIHIFDRETEETVL